MYDNRSLSLKSTCIFYLPHLQCHCHHSVCVCIKHLHLNDNLNAEKIATKNGQKKKVNWKRIEINGGAEERQAVAGSHSTLKCATHTLTNALTYTHINTPRALNCTYEGATQTQDECRTREHFQHGLCFRFHIESHFHTKRLQQEDLL